MLVWRGTTNCELLFFLFLFRADQAVVPPAYDDALLLGAINWDMNLG